MEDFESFVEELVFKVKNDEEFFREFVSFLKRFGKREILLRIVREILLDSCKNLKFSE